MTSGASMSAPPPSEASRRLAVAYRMTVAVGGGYAVAALFTLAFVDVLPLPRADAAMLVNMLAFVLFAVVVIWCVAAKSLRRVTVAMACFAAALAGAAFLSATGGAS